MVFASGQSVQWSFRQKKRSHTSGWFTRVRGSGCRKGPGKVQGYLHVSFVNGRRMPNLHRTVAIAGDSKYPLKIQVREYLVNQDYELSIWIIKFFFCAPCRTSEISVESSFQDDSVVLKSSLWIGQRNDVNSYFGSHPKERLCKRDRIIIKLQLAWIKLIHMRFIWHSN